MVPLDLIPKLNPEDYWVDAPHQFGMDNPGYPDQLDLLYFKDDWLTLETRLHGVTLRLTMCNAISFINSLERTHTAGSRNRVKMLRGGKAVFTQDERAGIRYVVLKTDTPKPRTLMRLSAEEARDMITWYREMRGRLYSGEE